MRNGRGHQFGFGTALLACAMVLAVTGCAKDGGGDNKSAGKDADKSLFERLGGEPALTVVVNDFVARAAADPKVNFTRKGVPGFKEWPATPENVAKLERRLVTFIAEATGGPKKYEGKDMKSSHAGMKITEAEFNALAGHLAASLDKFKVPKKEKDELMAIAASTKGAIVEQR